MKMNLALCVLALLLARPLYVVAEDACGLQPDLKLLVPYDVNGIDSVVRNASVMLPPTSAIDPNTDFDVDASWHVKAGKLYRVAPYCCETDWTMTEVNFVDGTTRATTTFDAGTKTWALAAEVAPGLNWWFIRAINAYAPSPSSTGERLVLVTCWGDLENASPFLF